MTDTGIPSELCARWQIAGAALIADTRSSRIFRVERLGAPAAIVKMLKPEGVHERPGIDYLAWREGRGAVRLLDRSDDACLLEDAGTMILRDYHRQHGDEAATEIVLAVLAELHAPGTSPPHPDLVPLRRHFSALLDGADFGDPSLGETLRWAAGLAEQLLSAQTDIRPLHGDLHHDNIVSGTPRGWLAIDPQGLIGDAAYDVANVFGNPIGGAKDILDPARIERLAKCFSQSLGCSPEKILRFAGAHAGLSISWFMEREATKKRDANVAGRLAFAKLVRQRLEGDS